MLVISPDPVINSSLLTLECVAILIRGVVNLRIFPVQMLNSLNKHPNIVGFNNLELTVKAILALEPYDVRSLAFLIANSYLPQLPLEYLSN